MVWAVIIGAVVGGGLAALVTYLVVRNARTPLPQEVEALQEAVKAEAAGRKAAEVVARSLATDLDRLNKWYVQEQDKIAADVRARYEKLRSSPDDLFAELDKRLGLRAAGDDSNGGQEG